MAMDAEERAREIAERAYPKQFYPDINKEVQAEIAAAIRSAEAEAERRGMEIGQRAARALVNEEKFRHTQGTEIRERLFRLTLALAAQTAADMRARGKEPADA